MPKFSQKSIDKLKTCHPDLQLLFIEVVKHFDCTILCGRRTKEEQNEAFRTRKSKLEWPDSLHNTEFEELSMAADAAPYPLDWRLEDKKNYARWYFFAGFVLGVAAQLGLDIVWGGDWDRDTDLSDQTFDDLVHFQVRRRK